MEATWVIVADNARARFFNWHKNGELLEFETLISPDQRLHESELVSDRRGRIGTSAGGRHGIGDDKGVKEHEREIFAAHVASRMEQGRTANQVKRMVLMAPPQCLGQIRSKLSASCERMIFHTVDKDLTRSLPDALVEYLPKTS